jgi:ring-1,2-phenylacetyl-CoA epoxidase subunit PaaE
MSVAFHTLTVADVVDETAEARSIRFAVPEELRETFKFKPGQHLTLKAEIAGEELRRNYSLCVAPQDGEVMVTVKRIAGGAFSNWANDNLRPGMSIEVMAPHGSFTWDFNEGAANHYVGFAGGSGITPVISLLKTALLTEPESRFTLFYGNRDSSSVIFLEALAQLKNRFMDRLQVYHFLAEEAEEFELFNGMLDRAKCDEILDSLIDPAEVAAVFICGPGPMMDAAEEALKARAVPADRIHLERFTAGRPSAALEAQMQALTQEAAGLTMLVTLDGRKRRVAFDAAAGNILDSARAAGLPAPFACKAGVCATCRARVVSGEIEMAARYGLTDEEVAAGYVLTCQSVPKGAGVELDYDA